MHVGQLLSGLGLPYLVRVASSKINYLTFKENDMYKYAFIGAGNMSKGIISGMVAAGVEPQHIITSTKTAESGQQLVAEFGVCNTQNNNECLDAEVVVLAVKPQLLAELLSVLDVDKLADKLVVSVIAGVPCAVYRKYIGEGIRLVRTMPNMPSKIGYGMTGMYAENCSAADKKVADELMQFTGKTLWVTDEGGIDYVNAISGSGPAYVYGFIHHLAQSGERLGLSYEEALTLATQTVVGSSHLVAQSGASSAADMQALIGQITSKGGTTFEAMQSFENDDFATIIDNAVQRCYARAIQLGKENN